MRAGRSQVIVTPTHLGIVMEYAAGAQRRCTRALRRNDGAEAQRSGSGGEIFDRICAKGRFSEEEARYFFKQLIAGVAYCHAQSVAHRDLKARGPASFALQLCRRSRLLSAAQLENALLDGSDPPQLKICDFGCERVR